MSGPPGPSGSTIAGILLFGEILRKAGSNCSFLPRLIGLTVYGSPISSSMIGDLASVGRAPGVQLDHAIVLLSDRPVRISVEDKSNGPQREIVPKPAFGYHRRLCSRQGSIMFAAPRPAGTLSANGRLAREAGALLALAWPLILANLAVTVMTTTDYVMLGLLSPGALAAGALGFNLYQPIFLLGVGVVGALSPIAAKKIGGGEAHEGVRRATHQAFLSALLIAAAGWLLLSQTTAILTAIGEPPDLARDAGRYMRAYQWALAPSLMFFAARSVFAALERPRLPLLAGLVAVVFNALANYVLIFGKFGLPALGIAGSGLATTLSQTLMLGLLVAFSLIDPRLRRLRLFALPWRPALGELAALWRLGLPIGLMITAEVGIFSGASLAMGLLGPATLVAHTIALQIAGLAFMVPLGLGQAVSVRIGRAYGAHDQSAIACAGEAAFGVTLAYALLSAARDDRRAAAAHFAVPGGRRAGERRGGRNRRRAPAGRGDLPGVRRKPGDARQHAARPARFPLAAGHRAHRLLGDRRAGRPGARLCDAARRGRGVDRACDRPRRRRAHARRALARQGAARFLRRRRSFRARDRRSARSRSPSVRRSRRSDGARSGARTLPRRRGPSRYWR